MNNIPLYVAVLIVLSTWLTVFFFYKASSYSKTTLMVLLCWLAIQSVIGLSGFYTVTNSMPPRFPLLVLPPVILIICLFVSKTGRAFIDRLNIKTLTLLHAVRIPVEIVLFWLYIHKTVPQVMTFEGWNFDILSGISALLIYYFGFVKHRLGRSVLLLWNFACLALLINIVVIAVLSAPLPFQQLAFDQPNIAVMYFPFVWLPCCIVPLVLFAHLASIRKLLLAGKMIEVPFSTAY
jgi:hypothetical protein